MIGNRALCGFNFYKITEVLGSPDKKEKATCFQVAFLGISLSMVVHLLQEQGGGTISVGLRSRGGSLTFPEGILQR
jgi:hypothetical protein